MTLLDGKAESAPRAVTGHVTDPDGHVLRFGADLREGEPMGEWLDGSGRRWQPTVDGGWRSAD
ncbi:MAG TPA: hypothetical protein VGP25_13660 [Gemmatimonadaceae bacterium]|jgi:hypothetical protein|nr:hypothetical protein [Gemmatimonadaceae bacterium]